MFKLLIVFYSAYMTTSLAFADLSHCYACAGPQSDCIVNNSSDLLQMDCKTYRVEGQSLISRTLEPELLEKLDSILGSRNTNTKSGCITLTFQDEKKTPLERALKTCFPVEVFEQDACTYVEELVSSMGRRSKSCHLCKSDYCNAYNGNGVPSLMIASLSLIYVSLNVF